MSKNLENKIIAFEIGVMCAVVATVCGLKEGCDRLEKRRREKKIAEIKRISDEYKNGATLIDKERSDGSYGYLYLDTDENKTIDVVVRGSTRTIEQRCSWQEAQPGDKKSVEAWANQLSEPVISIVPPRSKERF